MIQLLGQLGGFSSILLSIGSVITMSIGKKRWFDSIYKAINENEDPVKKDQVMTSLSHRVSYKGLYKLHDHINYISSLV